MHIHKYFSVYTTCTRTHTHTHTPQARRPHQMLQSLRHHGKLGLNEKSLAYALGERGWKARTQTCGIGPSRPAHHTHSSFHFHTSLRKSSRLSSRLLSPRSFHSFFSTTAYSKMRAQRIGSLWGKKALSPKKREKWQKTYLSSNPCMI